MSSESLKPTAEFDVASASGYRVCAAFRTDRGPVRPANEDSAIASVPEDASVLAAKGVLIVVADGMGGHEGGEVASALAVETVQEAYYASDEPPQRALASAFQRANASIYAHASAHQELAGMGTTCTAAVIVNAAMYSAHVGDSRIYLVRDGASYRMTQDHSAAMDLVNRGILTLEQADHHEDRNVILRAMGTHDQVDVSTWREPFPLHAGDRLVLCSDGLYESITDAEIAVIASEHTTPDTAADALLALALARQAGDNVTVAVAQIEGGA